MIFQLYAELEYSGRLRWPGVCLRSANTRTLGRFAAQNSLPGTHFTPALRVGLQRLAAQPCGASRVPAGLPAAPSSTDGHPAFFRRFQRRRCPPPSSPLTWPSGAPRWTLKSPDARPSRVGKRGFAPTLALGRLSASLPACVRVHRGSPTRPAAWTSGWRPRLRGSWPTCRYAPSSSARPPPAAPPACCPLALASSLRRLDRARATGSARLAVARLQVPPGSHAMQRVYQAACGY